MKAVAGGDVKPGMTILLEPGAEPFTVGSVAPWTTTASSLWLYNEYKTDLRTVRRDQWVAEVTQ